MVLVSEIGVLRIIRRDPVKGMSNKDISKEILKQNEDEEPDLGSIKVMVSRKTKQLIDQGEIMKKGRRFTITEKGAARLSTRAMIMSNFRWTPMTFPNIHVSIVGSPHPTRLISERRDLEDALRKLDEVLGDEEVMLLIRQKKDSCETP